LDLTRRRIPSITATSRVDGPTVFITAGAHGDEVGGVVVVHEVFRRLRKTPLFKGTLRALPLMNPSGFEQVTRTIADSREDLNRAFPGKSAHSGGSFAQQLAHSIHSTIVAAKPALAIDLHNDWRHSIPYAVLDAYPGPKARSAYRYAIGAAAKTGFVSLRERADESEEYQGSLSASLLRVGIPALTVELGESDVVNEANVDRGVRAIFNVLASMGMAAPLPGDAPPSPIPPAFRKKALRYSELPRSPGAGIVRFTVRPGGVVKPGMPIARISNSLGKVEHVVRAVHQGIVLGHRDTAVAYPGMALMAFAVLAQ
jgi:predicted deacylase